MPDRICTVVPAESDLRPTFQWTVLSGDGEERVHAFTLATALAYALTFLTTLTVAEAWEAVNG